MCDSVHVCSYVWGVWRIKVDVGSLHSSALFLLNQSSLLNLELANSNKTLASQLAQDPIFAAHFCNSCEFWKSKLCSSCLCAVLRNVSSAPLFLFTSYNPALDCGSQPLLHLRVTATDSSNSSILATVDGKLQKPCLFLIYSWLVL